jgi:hypothetical protein
MNQQPWQTCKVLIVPSGMALFDLPLCIIEPFGHEELNDKGPPILIKESCDGLWHYYPPPNFV